MIHRRTETRPWAVVLAGGSGRRLASITRRFPGPDWPKQFQTFGMRRSLLQETMARIRPMAPPSRTAVVVNAPYRDVAAQQLADFPGVRLVSQPFDRGTAAGIFLPLSAVMREDPDSTVMIFPSDHGIDNQRRFTEGLRSAISAVQTRPDLIVVGGVRAASPNTDYGWIVHDDSTQIGGRRDVYPVRYFAEKPGQEEARALHGMGALWSTFVIVARTRALCALLRDSDAVMAGFFDDCAARPGTTTTAWLAENYHRLPVVDFSSGVLARAPSLGVLAWPETLGWTDLGTPERLAGWLARCGRGPGPDRAVFTIPPGAQKGVTV